MRRITWIDDLKQTRIVVDVDPDQLVLRFGSKEANLQRRLFLDEKALAKLDSVQEIFDFQESLLASRYDYFVNDSFDEDLIRSENAIDELMILPVEMRIVCGCQIVVVLVERDRESVVFF